MNPTVTFLSSFFTFQTEEESPKKKLEEAYLGLKVCLLCAKIPERFSLHANILHHISCKLAYALQDVGYTCVVKPDMGGSHFCLWVPVFAPALNLNTF